MTIQTNTSDRRTLVYAIAEELHTEPRYLRAPTYAYQVGGYTVDRYGNITGDDLSPIHDLLVAGGYIADDADPAEEPTTETTAIEAATTEDTEAPTVAELVMTTEPTEDAQPAEEPADSKEEQQPATANTIDEQTITIPASGITVEQLRNLTFLLYSRQYILNLMTGGDTIRIPVELVEALQEALPATPEDFSTLLDSYRELGLAGFDFRDGQFSLAFPFYETEPTKWTTFAGLQGRILQTALAATRVFPELIRPEEEAEKYTAHMWLQRMGYKGPEMKEQRNILLKHLHGYCAFSNGSKMQNHKDKYSAIRRERREAERKEHSSLPTDSEAKPNVSAKSEEE